MSKYACVGPFTSVEQIERASARSGFYFFMEVEGAEDANVRTFLEPVYGGRFFIVEEDFVGDPPYYQLAMAREDGDIEVMAGRARYPSRRGAEDAIVIALATGPIEVRFDPDPSEGTLAEPDADPGHFHWRPYIGDLAVGERQARESAELLVAEITG
jgi:hypothetical protein